MPFEAKAALATLFDTDHHLFSPLTRTLTLTLTLTLILTLILTRTRTLTPTLTLSLTPYPNPYPDPYSNWIFKINIYQEMLNKMRPLRKPSPFLLK